MLPPTEIEPLSGISRPAIERKVVVLPQPDGPRRREQLAFLDVERDVVDCEHAPVLLAARGE